MSPEPSAIAAALARAWKAIVTAFTTTRDPRRSRLDGMDTTMLGGLPEQPGAPRGLDSAKQSGWDPTGESTDFADAEVDPGRRRRR